ncbi:hypothetical protein B0H67DRAFT_146885 [Lasiosphaeris hirsuta]|uniref:Uncharacterized protein n=1 Tax=Lasiosphaeris hirsuta TaxID=260670 RepID=A0AA40B1S6_9PEZI|nr:hypothetical protein B0H67DRAFT_146885 [Lasiosphaeris hirsuta]
MRDFLSSPFPLCNSTSISGGMMESRTSQSTAPTLPSTGGIFGRPRLNLEKNEIRVMTLRPGRWADSLRTVQLDLEDRPHYEALSYMPGETQTFCCQMFLLEVNVPLH